MPCKTLYSRSWRVASRSRRGEMDRRDWCSWREGLILNVEMSWGWTRVRRGHGVALGNGPSGARGISLFSLRFDVEKCAWMRGGVGGVCTRRGYPQQRGGGDIEE